MKILGVKFKNLSAMKGEWEIRFDQPPLADTGLFAIVGPNGSGKTTILDALSLALYGETPRMKNPESGIINWQASDSFAEVTFSVGIHMYRSKWSGRKVAGRPEPPEMVLASLNGTETMLEDRVIRVRDRVAELTGLDFKRFCRSILLAQGDFAAFLDALENERAEILERIIGPELARELEETIRSQVHAEEARILELKEAAALYPAPDKARIDALEESVGQAQEELEETNRILGDLKAQEEWLQRVDLLESSQFTAAEACAIAEAHHAQAREDLQRLESARPASPFQEAVKVLNGLQTEAEAAKSQLNQLETDIQTHELQTHELEERLRENRTGLDQARHRLQGRSEQIQGAWLRDRDIAAEEQHLLETTSQHQTLQLSQSENLQQQADIATHIPALQSRQQEIDQWLTESARDARLETDLPVVEEILNRLNETRNQAGKHQSGKPEAAKLERRSARELRRAEKATQKAQRKTERLDAGKKKRERRLGEILADGTLDSLVADYHDRKKRLTACKRLIKIGQEYREQVVNDDLHQALANIRAEQDRLAQSLALEQTQLAELDETVQWREALKKLAPERAALKPANPCPLCGALDHPYIEQGVPEFAAVVHLLREQHRKVTALRIQVSSLRASETELRAQASTLATIHLNWAEACAEAGGEWAITSPEIVVQEIRSRRKENKRCKSRIRSARWQNWRRQRLERSLLSKSGRLTVKEQARDQAHQQYEVQHQELTDLEGELHRLRQVEQAARELLAEQLEAAGESLPAPDQETQLLLELGNRRQRYRDHLLERDSLSTQIGALEARHQALPQELERIREELQAAAEEVQAVQDRLIALRDQRQGLFGVFDPVLERQELENDIEFRNAEQLTLHQEIETIRRALREEHTALPEAKDHAQQTQAAAAEAEAILLEQALAAAIGSLHELRTSVLWLEKEEIIRERHAATEQLLTEARSRQEEAQQALALAQTEPATEDSLELIRWKMLEAGKHRDALQVDLRDQEADLREQREAERDYREMLRTIAEQQKVCDRMLAQQRALQSQDPNAVRSKLQRLMLERLLDRANSHLEVLSGRYFLRPLSEEGFGLQVEDALQARTARPVKTLSGGESFVVSLCLALGLSEMASDERRIESLFLDEGFGTLDDEMLYRVMAALKRLRANGKMVGVISHVKRLADEIPTQIRVEKQPGGSSRIAVVA